MFFFFSIKGDSLLERVYTKGWSHRVSTESFCPLIISSLSNSLSFQQPWPKFQPRNRPLSLSLGSSLLYSSMAKAPSISFSSLLSFSISFNIFLVVLAGGGWWWWFWAGLWVVGYVVACGLLGFCYQPAIGWWSWWIWVAVRGCARKYFQEGYGKPNKIVMYKKLLKKS